MENSDVIKDKEFEVEEFQFRSFSKVLKAEDRKAKEFQFDMLDGMKPKEKQEHQLKISKERNHARSTNFKISPIVREYRGLFSQEEKEVLERIDKEVSRKVGLQEEEARKRGFEEGVKQGREEIFAQTKASVEEKLSSLSAMIADVFQTRSDILNQQAQEIYKMVKTLTKWIILRELKDDDGYMERLLEKLIIELQSKSNLLVQVNQKEFERMPEVLEIVQEKLGELSNVRLEIDFDIENKGMIVESENGIINGSLEEQFKSLDRLFETVDLYESESE